MNFHSSDNQPDFYSSAVTQIKIWPPEWKLDGRGLFFMGSCFADYLYSEYRAAGLNAAISPFGNIYNPDSLASAAEMMNEGAAAIKVEDCFNTARNEMPQYRHFMFHSLKTADTAEELARTIAGEVATAREYLKDTEAAVITLGTAWVFKQKNGTTVNNCHKLPASGFDRSLLSIDEASASIQHMIRSLKEINSELKIIISLSPVRHMRDNATENSLSKAILRCAIDSACKGRNDIWYYPSYEIMLDELRDYRWYADDLCHPSTKAVSFIISRFINNIYSNEFHAFMNEWTPVLKDLQHKAFNPDSAEYIRFRENSLKRLDVLKQKFPGLVSEEPVSLQ